MVLKISSILNILIIISFLLFLFAVAQVLTPLKISLFDSEWLFMYLCCVLGAFLGFVGTRKKNSIQSIRKIGIVSLYGNLAMVVIFFPPFYFLWGTILESIL